MIKTSGKEFKNLQRRLKAANKRFQKLSRAEQRVAIAEDVIAQLEAKKIKAAHTYLKVSALHQPKVQELDASECFAQTQCQVCGIGSLFVSAVMKADNLLMKDISNTINAWGTMRDDVQLPYLAKWFNSDQLDLVENYYEQNLYLVSEDSSPIHDEADSKKRMIMIMENIISNRGKFDPFRGAHKNLDNFEEEEY